MHFHTPLKPETHLSHSHFLTSHTLTLSRIKTDSPPACWSLCYLHVQNITLLREAWKLCVYNLLQTTHPLKSVTISCSFLCRLQCPDQCFLKYWQSLALGQIQMLKLAFVWTSLSYQAFFFYRFIFIFSYVQVCVYIQSLLVMCMCVFIINGCQLYL